MILWNQTFDLSLLLIFYFFFIGIKFLNFRVDIWNKRFFPSEEIRFIRELFIKLLIIEFEVTKRGYPCVCKLVESFLNVSPDKGTGVLLIIYQHSKSEPT